jgi:hypothetical protein
MGGIRGENKGQQPKIIILPDLYFLSGGRWWLELVTIWARLELADVWKEENISSITNNRTQIFRLRDDEV